MYRAVAVCRFASGILRSGLRSDGRSRVRSGIVAALVASACALAASPAVRARPEVVDASGTGAAAAFSSGDVIDGTPVTVTATLFVSTPSDGSGTRTVAVGVTETVASTGAVRFTGTGSAAVDSFEVREDLSYAHLQAEVVTSSAGGAVRVVELNVVWNADDDADTVDVSLNGKKATTGFQSEQHEGTVRSTAVTGVVQVSDPPGTGHVTTLSASGPGSLWSTTDTARLSPQDETAASTGSGAGATEVGALATTGSWTGYWTWRWTSSTTGYWFWTWVWVTSSGSYVTS